MSPALNAASALAALKYATVGNCAIQRSYGARSVDPDRIRLAQSRAAWLTGLMAAASVGMGPVTALPGSGSVSGLEPEWAALLAG